MLAWMWLWSSAQDLCCAEAEDRHYRRMQQTDYREFNAKTGVLSGARRTGVKTVKLQEPQSPSLTLVTLYIDVFTFVFIRRISCSLTCKNAPPLLSGGIMTFLWNKILYLLSIRSRLILLSRWLIDHAVINLSSMLLCGGKKTETWVLYKLGKVETNSKWGQKKCCNADQTAVWN